jgi:zinc transporter ZupT
LVIEHDIPAAVATPSPGGMLGLMALLGTYVGIIPIALGMMVLPLLRRGGPTMVRVLLALTVGLLAFLAADGSIEAIGLGQHSDGAFGGPALVVLGAGLAFLVLTAIDSVLRKRQQRGAPSRQGGLQLAVMIAIGIGLHNLGEGLAIGSAYAVGELALGAFLVIGFALHNTTEGIAIVAPLAKQPPSFARLAALCLLAGAPAIPGAILGATVVNAELSALLLGVGVGAIAQVIVQIVPALRAPGQKLGAETLGGISAGVVVMYLTGLLVTA